MSIEIRSERVKLAKVEDGRPWPCVGPETVLRSRGTVSASSAIDR